MQARWTRSSAWSTALSCSVQTSASRIRVAVRPLARSRKYGIPFDVQDDTEALRRKLAQFYVERSLSQSAISPADQAEVAYLLISDAFRKTTGHIVPVDGGLHEAFLR